MKRLILITISIMLLAGCGVDVKPGQVWVHDGGSKDPFKPEIHIEQTVIAVKNGYVQYKEGSRVESNSISYFKLGAHLKQDVPQDDVQKKSIWQYILLGHCFIVAIVIIARRKLL